MIECNTTVFYFFEPKLKMETILKEIFCEKEKDSSGGVFFNPEAIFPIPIGFNSEEDRIDLIKVIWGFTNSIFCSYFLYKDFSVIEFGSDGDASRLFAEFSIKNNLKYFSKTSSPHNITESIFYFRGDRDNIGISLSNSLQGIPKIKVEDLFDFKKFGIEEDYTTIIENHHTRNDLISSNGSSNFINDTLREKEYESDAWKSLDLLGNTVENLSNAKPFLRKDDKDDW